MRWRAKCKKEARKLPKEKRQEFLDLMWKGKTIREAYETCKISFDEANGIMMLNIKEVSHLRRESV